ncbi:MAG: ATP synthase F1 subunit delta [Candidatus Omnitrophica bacterium]|nr:ATP synthase F1 subunit delta [Candidatus Omnitrophota bacterium]
MTGDLSAARRYAAALFNLAVERKVLEKVEKDFFRVIELLKQHPEISSLVSNFTVAQAEKEDFIDKVFPRDMERLLLYFLKVLTHKKRFTEISAIQEQFHLLFEKKAGIQEVHVITAVTLSEKNKEKLISVLEKRFKSEIRLALKTDAKILGGMILRFDGKEINGGYKNRLHEIRQKLISKS